MYAVYDANDFRKADRIQLLILFIGFSIAVYIWIAMGIDVTDPDGGGTYQFFNKVLPAVIDHGITTNVGYFFWRMVDAFSFGRMIICLIMGAICTAGGILLITDIRPTNYVF